MNFNNLSDDQKRLLMDDMLADYCGDLYRSTSRWFHGMEQADQEDTLALLESAKDERLTRFNRYMDAVSE